MRNGAIHVGEYGQIDPRQHVAAVDGLDRETTRWWDPLARFFGYRPLRRHGRRTLWVPVAWMSRDELDAFLDEARQLAARRATR